MSLRNEAVAILESVKAQNTRQALDEQAFNIYEGDLLSYILEDLKDHLSANAFRQIKTRVAPINLLQRFVDKVSTIYSTNPSRTVLNGTEQDIALLDWYEKSYKINSVLSGADEFINITKRCLLIPYIGHNRTPRLRVVPAHMFSVFSCDSVEPTTPTHVVTYQGDRKDVHGNTYKLFYITTKDEIIAVNERGGIDTTEMAAMNNPEGINPLGVLPFVYVNKSKHLLTPIRDTDILKMAKVIPIVLSDLNYAVMFQAFSLIYGIDVNFSNIEMNPNTFLDLKSDVTSVNPPKIGVIKPEVDIDAVLNLVKTLVTLWLDTKGIKAGAIGSVDEKSASSGISKIIDEMDATEYKSKQVNLFTEVEEQLWNLVFNHIHPYSVKNNLIENKTLMTIGSQVETNFAPQVPSINRGAVVKDLDLEIKARLTTRRRAIKKINPHMTDEEIEILLKEIEEENGNQMAEDSNPDKQETQS